MGIPTLKLNIELEINYSCDDSLFLQYILVTRNHARTEEPAKTQGWIPTSVSVRADSKEPIAKKVNACMPKIRVIPQRHNL